jgi:hypothetical protein
LRLAARLKPLEGADLLARALEKVTNNFTRCLLAQGLAGLATRLEPDQAASVCGHAAELLTRALEKEAESFGQEQLAVGLAALAARLEPAQCARVCGTAADLLARTLAGC